MRAYPLFKPAKLKEGICKKSSLLLGKKKQEELKKKGVNR